MNGNSHNNFVKQDEKHSQQLSLVISSFITPPSVQMDGITSSEGEEMSALRWQIDQRKKQVGMEDSVLPRGHVEVALEMGLGTSIT